jgi:RNA exonuclease 4
MPVTTIPANQTTFVNGRLVLKSQLATKSNSKYGHQAYNNSARSYNRYKCRAGQRTPRLDLVTPGSPVALDCEGVLLPQNVGREKCGIGRVSMTNVDGKVVYDSFVHYPDDVEHRPSPQRLCLGVKYKDIMPKNGAQPHAKVLADAKSVFDKSGIIVAHAASNDTNMLRGIDFSGYVIRDTQDLWWEPYTGDRSRGLASIASSVLGRSIQTMEHSSVEDARATMDLFLFYRKHSQHEAGRGYDGEPLVKSTPVDNVGTSGGAITSDSDSNSDTPTSDTSPLGNVTTNTSPSGGATTLSSGSPTSDLTPLETVSSNTSASSKRSFAPGHLVALPDIKAFARGRVFDRKTSTYL